MAHSEEAVGQELFQDKVVCGWEDALAFEQESLVADSIERLSDVEKDRRADLLQFKGGGYSVNQSVTLLDGGVEKAELGYIWEKSLKE